MQFGYAQQIVYALKLRLMKFSMQILVIIAFHPMQYGPLSLVLILDDIKLSVCMRYWTICTFDYVYFNMVQLVWYTYWAICVES